jgi:hypothetical protein
LRDASTGDNLILRKQGRTLKRILCPARSLQGWGPRISFPYDIFETAILSLLKEVNPADVLGREPKSETSSIAADLAAREQRARQIEAELAGDEGDVPSLARVLRKLDEECASLKKRLAEARQKESNPRGVAWAETLTLLDIAKDEASRLRLRELLRTIISEIYVLIFPMASHRLAVVQIHFAGDGHRDFLIHYQSAGHGRKGGCRAGSLPPETRPDDLDLRRKADADGLRKLLSEVDIIELVDAMRAGVERSS